MDENVRSVDTDFCSEFFQRPVNVMPWRNEHYATSPHIPAGRVAVRPSCIHQNASSVDTEFCSGFFHRPVNVVPWRNEHYATPPHTPGGRVAVAIRMHENVRSVGSEFFTAGECLPWRRTLRYFAAYTGGRVAVRPSCIIRT
ncbi:hypothetical protein TNCT_571621 [Trichonephila clavata]|uniref:Uncharacterized protein n=1 Tax=Trichonephila clavata TaxID=2740835 RepID=A0A8X6H2K3_TRICU|nr:hypothetical protein TNCT_571621 [Trichonephila clavata]